MHPCLQCGACCSQHRVVFDWVEGADITPNGVPLENCLPHGSRERCMAGTEEGGRCSALSGEIGQETTCLIHSRRPSVCRAFMASYEHGRHEKRCDHARSTYNLPPLKPADWDTVES